MIKAFWLNAKRIIALGTPVWVGQLAVIVYGVIDTAMIARTSALDLAALAVGSAAYITVFVGLQGIVQAVSPMVGQLYGAGRLLEIGQVLREGAWLAAGVALAAVLCLAWTWPWLQLTRASPELGRTIAHYLWGLALAVPAAIGFRLFASFNTALSRPQITMRIQLGALAFKVALNWLLIFELGWGAPGCAWATALVMWGMFLVSLGCLKWDSFYQKFELGRDGWQKPTWAAQRELLRLGLPMGAAYLIEVSGFTFMALFIARLGAVPVAGHQIAANLSTVLFMTPLALGQAASTLVAQSVGAGHRAQARQLGWHGIVLATILAVLMALLLWVLREPLLRAYSSDPVIVQAAFSLLALSLTYHVLDSCQTVAAFTLRAYKVATLPMLIYALCVWGVGLGVGYALAFNLSAHVPLGLQGAAGFWAANIVGLTLASLLLCLTLKKVSQ
jgi:MATE family multidrug resistance protein